MYLTGYFSNGIARYYIKRLRNYISRIYKADDFIGLVAVTAALCPRFDVLCRIMCLGFLLEFRDVQK